MKGAPSYYEILGVNSNASNHELRKAFCRLSIELHPDTTSLELDDAQKKFQQVLEAYENLNNIQLRKLYDEKLREESKKSFKKEINTLIIDTNGNNLVGNRRPYSKGEMFSLFLLIIIIFVSLIFSIFIASFSGKELDTLPIWLIK